jgi:hypothetical protein
MTSIARKVLREGPSIATAVALILMASPAARSMVSPGLNEIEPRDRALRGSSDAGDRFFLRLTARQFPAEQVSRAHIEWCYKKHRTYRLLDNTYLGNDGKRHKCRSPYN